MQKVPEERFEFGENWRSYSRLIDEDRIRNAQERLARLLGTDSLIGKRFLDIGCGSGLHSLAALRLGAKEIVGIDLDANSAETARAVLSQKWPHANKTVDQLSVFDLDPSRYGAFDIVYSWGVLHHTGDMNQAIIRAAACVQPGGLFAVALYGKTRYCGMWKRIKRWYVNATPEKKAWAERLYVRLFGFYQLLRGRRLSTYIANYQQHKRGMEFYHDVRDWIGGYPYESISPSELDALLRPRGFELVQKKVRRRSGLFGSGNDEYLYRLREA